MQELKSTEKAVGLIEVTLMESGVVCMTKQLDKSPMGMAIGQNFKPESNKDLGDAVMDLLRLD